MDAEQRGTVRMNQVKMSMLDEMLFNACNIPALNVSIRPLIINLETYTCICISTINLNAISIKCIQFRQINPFHPHSKT
jgi:hypothetical protein